LKQVEIREGARRQHRIIALLAVFQCWTNNLDGVDRTDLERLIGLERFKGKRASWLQEDFKEFFSYQEIITYQGRKDSLSSIYVSRRPLEDNFPKGTMDDEKRVRLLKSGGHNIEKLALWPKPYPRVFRRANKEEFGAAIPIFPVEIMTSGF
jgi:hypothetical protein